MTELQNAVAGFALSQEQLLAALLIQDLPAPVGHDDLSARVFGALPEEARMALMAAAERALIAQGLLDAGQAPPPQLQDDFATALRICTQPERTWVLLHQPAGDPARRSQIYEREGLLLAHMELIGVHQFVQLASRDDVAMLFEQLVEPLDGQVPALQGQLREDAFAALATSPRLTAESAQRQLVAGGLSAEVAQAFAATFEQLVSITACARIVLQPQPTADHAFTVVRGQQAQWILAVEQPGVLLVRSLTGEQLRHAQRSFAVV